MAYITPGKNVFPVLPNNVSRSAAVGAIVHPGGPARVNRPHRSVQTASPPTPAPSRANPPSTSPPTHIYLFSSDAGRLPSSARCNSGFSGGFGNTGGLEKVDILFAIAATRSF
ncbi:hypothetical protein B0H34DRAFT_69278 [Crassisporium funariophilum]|nr:hypothetical protein B0H34DRAFT_69278 [Crassisporium funariophilum]